MKQCIKCGEVKELTEFYKHKTSKDGVLNRCKTCTNKINAEWYKTEKGLAAGRKRQARYREKHKETLAEKRKNPTPEQHQRMLASFKRHRQKNKEKLAIKHKEYIRKNPEKGREKAKRWQQKNPEYKRLTHNRWRSVNRSRIKRATPAWADHEKIKAFYNEAARLTAETGIVHHVDHEIPILGKFVSGLNVETNLRVVPAIDNFIKNNRYDLGLTEEDEKWLINYRRQIERQRRVLL